MKHSVAVKFLAILLCALSVVSIVGCGFGILFMENWNLYNMPLETLKMQQLDSISNAIAWNHAQIHAAQSLSNCPQEILDDVLIYNSTQGNYAVEIYLGTDLVYSVNKPTEIASAHIQEHLITPQYPIVTSQYRQGNYPSSIEETQPIPFTEPFATDQLDIIAIPAEEALPAQWTIAREEALDRVAGQDVLYSSEHTETFRSDSGSSYQITYTLDYYTAPEYLVVVYLDDQAALGTEYALMSVLYPYRNNFIPGLLVSLLFFAVTLVYLFAAAGHSKQGIQPAGLNKLPLDIYGFGAVSGVTLVLLLLAELLENFDSGYYGIWDNLPLCMLVIGSVLFVIALLILGFLFACVAQSKLKGGYWWRHSLCGWCLLQLRAFLRWVRRGLQYFYRGCRAVVRLLPIIWQWPLTAFAMLFVPFLFALFTAASYGFGEFFWGLLLVLSIATDIALVFYGAWCFGILFKGVRHMAQGNLDHQIDIRFLFGCFKDFALHLNSLADAAKQAAEKQMRSERMKTELITNVSHDIKTPLTSIINYVDLIKKPHSEEDHATYLDVLDRQSLRLKKLVEDLVDMSKASSGSMSVDFGQIDAVEAINQALGEFSDKLEQVNLTPVFRHPDTPVIMQADGRHLWRVMSNLLSNAVKYAMPDTRLYVDLMTAEGNAVLAIKNISRDQLNINAEELMERFVRGDASRNTEGSGLGLNIAKSLVELQNGQMHLMVDGDLFKVTLIFPLA